MSTLTMMAITVTLVMYMLAMGLGLMRLLRAGAACWRSTSSTWWACW